MAAKDLEIVKQLYNYIAEVCQENYLDPYLPHQNTDPIKNSETSDIEVYRTDLNEMLSSTLVISYIGEPSLGVGAELSICLAKNIPIIAVKESNRKVSRFLLGMLKTSKNVAIIDFNSKEELKLKLVEHFGHFLLLKDFVPIHLDT